VSNGTNGSGKLVPFRRPPSGTPRVRMAEPDPEPEKPSLAQRFKASPLTFLIGIVNVAYFIWIEQHGSSNDLGVLVRFGAVESSLVHAGDYWRIASYMIVHIGWGHLIMNTWAGASWCTAVERMMGTWRFLLLYVIAGLGGGAAVVVFSDAVTAGASGAMFGIIGALLTIRYRQLPTWTMFTRDPGVRSTVAQIALWTVLGIVALPMSQAGHFGGLITGAAFTFALTQRTERVAAPSDGRAASPHATVARLTWVAFAVAFLGFVLFALRPFGGAPEVDWAAVKINRTGIVANRTKAVVVQAGPACQRGVQRACVVQALTDYDLDDAKGREKASAAFEKACNAGDRDGCAGWGMLLGEKDIVRAEKIIHEACAAGSEWGCDLAGPNLEGLEPLPWEDAGAPDGAP
jgi:membrane associated rhomboid family serine protease